MPARAMSDAQLVDRYCAGMITQFYNPDGTRTDCISATHAIEVELSQYWATAIGQSLHYALWTVEFSENPSDFARWYRQVSTPRKAGIIFACSDDRRLETCANHVVRAKRIAEEYRIRITIWDCDPSLDMTLAECQKLEYPTAQ